MFLFALRQAPDVLIKDFLQKPSDQGAGRNRNPG
jgi:hypothetical protein